MMTKIHVTYRHRQRQQTSISKDTDDSQGTVDAATNALLSLKQLQLAIAVQQVLYLKLFSMLKLGLTVQTTIMNST